MSLLEVSTEYLRCIVVGEEERTYDDWGGSIRATLNLLTSMSGIKYVLTDRHASGPHSGTLL